MPFLFLPLALNLTLIVSAWICEMSFFIQIILTIITVLKFVIVAIAILIMETEWLKIVGYIVSVFFNALLIITGITYNSFGIILSASLLIVLFIVWRVIPCVCVK